jgi:hypothetical protein
MKILKEKKKKILLLIAIVGYIILIIFVPFNGRIDVNGCNYGKNIIFFYLLGMVGIGSTIFLSLLYRRSNKIVTIIANGTVIIMTFHGISTGLIFRIIGLRGEDIINPFVGIFVSTASVFLFSFPIIMIKKYFPILTGGKKLTV